MSRALTSSSYGRKPSTLPCDPVPPRQAGIDLFPTMSGSAKIDENKKKHYIDPLRDYDQSPTPEADDLWVSKSSGSEGNAGGHSGKKKAKEKKEKKGKKKEGKAKKKEKGETKQSGGEEQKAEGGSSSGAGRS